jgi:signal transduction histidine kinase
MSVMRRGLPGGLAVLVGLAGAMVHAVNASAGRTAEPSFWLMGFAAAVGYGLLAVVLRDVDARGLRLLAAGIGIAQGGSLLASEWALLGPDVALGGWAAWLGSWLWAPGYVGLLAVLPQLLPDGHLLDRRWRPALWLGAAATGYTALYWALMPYSEQDFPEALSSWTNPVGTQLAASTPADALAAALLVPAVAVAVATVVVRWRRAATLERQQLKWILLGVSGTVLLALLARLVPLDAAGAVGAVAMLPLPLSVGVAVLRHGLWDVDLVISRALLYGALSAAVVVGYVAVVWTLGTLLGATVATTGTSAVSAALVALAVLPLHHRVQRAVNRLVHGDEDEPYAVLARLGDRLGAAEDPDHLADQVLPSVLEQLCRSLRARGAQLVLADGSVARHGTIPDDGATLAIPLDYGGRQLGRLDLARPGGFGWDAERALGRLGQQAAVAAHTVLLAREARQAREEIVVAREEERRRLRRDLHDGVGPSLAAVALQVETARDLAGQDPAAAVSLLDRLVPRLNAAVADVRALVNDLRPPTLDELGLASAVRELAGRLSTAGTRVEVEVDVLGELPAAVEVAAYRIAAEAVTNAVRHAGATRVEVRLRRDEHDLVVEVVDDGHGFEAGAVDGRGDGSGVGLPSMQARAEELGGTFAVTAGESRGTCVRAALPLALARAAVVA